MSLEPALKHPVHVVEPAPSDRLEPWLQTWKYLEPEAYTELGRMHLLAPANECFGREVVWSHPAFAICCVFARNDRELVYVSLAE